MLATREADFPKHASLLYRRLIGNGVYRGRVPPTAGRQTIGYLASARFCTLGQPPTEKHGHYKLISTLRVSVTGTLVAMLDKSANISGTEYPKHKLVRS